MTLTKKSLVLLLVLIFLALPSVAFAEETLLPSLNISIGEAEGPQEVASTLTLVLLLTILSLVPSILILATAFTRIVIVLSLLRNAMGLQQIPPNQVIIGLALFLTIF
ncbi:MAG TPA: flagellar biosynthetic protein FliP, partial [Bacillota bacterium]|nr:flagellar biosynthetic protein FliP [Bacillota bacterium]